MTTRTYTITNSLDASQAFDIESVNIIDAALKALEQLGWSITREEAPARRLDVVQPAIPFPEQVGR